MVLSISEILKILPKFEIYFLSNKKEFEKMKNNFFKRNFGSFKKIGINSNTQTFYKIK